MTDAFEVGPSFFSTMVGNNANASLSGYWGPTDSLLDFCEPNYATSPYIAEFYNAFSHLPMVLYVLAGGLLMHRARPAGLHSRHWGIIGVLLFVSAGSIIYHSTLRYYGQMVDELPMLFYNLVVLYHLNARKRSELPRTALVDWRAFIPLFTFGLAQIVVYGYLKLYAFFFVCFAGTVVMEILQAAFAVRRLRDAKVRKQCSWIMVRGTSMILFALCVWLIERLQCPYHEGTICAPIMNDPAYNGSIAKTLCSGIPLLHGVWHIGSSQAGYMMGLLLILIQQPQTHRPASQNRWGLEPFYASLIEIV